MSRDSARGDGTTAAAVRLPASGEVTADSPTAKAEGAEPNTVDVTDTSASSPSSRLLTRSHDPLEDLVVGTLIDTKYRIDGVIGRGAMGMVAAATHVNLGERVAIKFLDVREDQRIDDFRARFRREAQVSAKLRNEHITRVHDLGLWNDRVPFMVMELLVGEDLSQRLAKQGRLGIAIAVDYIVQVCEGVAEAHANGIVHRDLKPSNLFVTKRADGTELLRILDFGVSKWTAADEKLDALTQSGVILGTPKYMAPEQLFGSSEVDSRADVWAIGAILFQMLAGRPPFNESTLTRHIAELAARTKPAPLRELNPQVSASIEEVVLRCLTYDIESRIQNVAELAGALLAAMGDPTAAEVEQKLAAVLSTDPSFVTLGRGAARARRNAKNGASMRTKAVLGAVLAVAVGAGIWATRAAGQKAASVPAAAAVRPESTAIDPPVAATAPPSPTVSAKVPAEAADPPTAPARGPSSSKAPVDRGGTRAPTATNTTRTPVTAKPVATASAAPTAAPPTEPPREAPKRTVNPLEDRQ